MKGALETLNHIFSRLLPTKPQTGSLESKGPPAGRLERDPGRAPAEGLLTARDDGSASMETADDGEPNEAVSSRRARLVSAYLNIRAEEMLALLLEDLSRDAARELSRTVQHSYQSVSAELAGVRESVGASQRDLSRIGRELIRSGAAIESIQAAVSESGPVMRRLENLLQSQLEQESARGQRLREEVERSGIDDLLATLDGLEAGLDDGQSLLQELEDARRRLKDATVARWWRAMGEATGVKRPLPDVPVAGVQSWIEGLELTRRRLLDALARRGVMPIEAVGRPFDPHLHEAVAVEPCPAEQDGLVLREQRRGYRASDRIVRLSQVVVGRGEPGKTRNPHRRRRRIAAEQVDEGVSSTGVEEGSQQDEQAEDNE